MKNIIESLKVETNELETHMLLSQNQKALVPFDSAQPVDYIVVNKDEAKMLHTTIGIWLNIQDADDLYERAISALKVAEAPEFAPGGNVAEMDATNERKFADSTPVLLVAHIFGKKNTQVAADVIGQAREPEGV